MAAMPEGYSSVTPTIVSTNAAQAIELYTKAFGAKEAYRLNCPETGKIMHACVQIGSSKVFLSDANPEMGCAATTSSFYLYMDDVDAAARQAKQAGFQEMSPVQDMFWGDRTGSFKDSFGNSWTLATHVRDVSPAEMEAGRDKFIAMMKASKGAKAA